MLRAFERLVPEEQTVARGSGVSASATLLPFWWRLFFCWLDLSGYGVWVCAYGVAQVMNYLDYWLVWAVCTRAVLFRFLCFFGFRRACNSSCAAQTRSANC